MNRKTLAALVAVNVVLLGFLLLSVLTGGQPAYAQVEAPGRGGDYVMLAGDLSSRTQQAVYIIDQRSAQVLTLLFTSTTRRLELIGSRDLSEIATARPTR